MPKAKKRGGKTAKEQINILHRYAQLTPAYFKLLEKYLEGTKKEQAHALKCLSPAFIKMIPQDVANSVQGKISISISKDISDKFTKKKERSQKIVDKERTDKK